MRFSIKFDTVLGEATIHNKEDIQVGRLSLTEDEFINWDWYRVLEEIDRLLNQDRLDIAG